MTAQYLCIASLASLAAGIVLGSQGARWIGEKVDREPFDVVSVDQCHCRLIGPDRHCSFTLEAKP